MVCLRLWMCAFRTHYHAKSRREGEREGKGSNFLFFFLVLVVYVCVFKKLDNVKKMLEDLKKFICKKDDVRKNL